MGRAQKLKQQRRVEERRKELEKKQKASKIYFWSIISTVALGLIALILVVVLVKLPTYGKQMVIETDKGNIIVEMKEEDAPATTAHIEALVNNGSYQGASFYSVDEIAAMTGVQGRDTSTGESTEVMNKRGAVGMAKPSDSSGTPMADSGTNEFYILKTDTPSLDPNFTIFGQVSEGMDLVDGLAAGTVINSIALSEGGTKLIINQDAGDIVIDLDTEGTPQTVAHLTDLINQGFYTDMNWYRVEDFVVQTGSHARSLEAAGADQAAVQAGAEQDNAVPTVVDELKYAAPEVDVAMTTEESVTVPMEGKLPAVRGAALLYWQPQDASAEEQQSYFPTSPTEFALMKKDYSDNIGTGLTVFGEVIEGMPVVDSLANGDKINNVYIREVRK